MTKQGLQGQTPRDTTCSRQTSTQEDWKLTQELNRQQGGTFWQILPGLRGYTCYNLHQPGLWIRCNRSNATSSQGPFQTTTQRMLSGPLWGHSSFLSSSGLQAPLECHHNQWEGPSSWGVQGTAIPFNKKGYSWLDRVGELSNLFWGTSRVCQIFEDERTQSSRRSKPATNNLEMPISLPELPGLIWHFKLQTPAAWPAWLHKVFNVSYLNLPSCNAYSEIK